MEGGSLGALLIEVIVGISVTVLSIGEELLGLIVGLARDGSTDGVSVAAITKGDRTVVGLNDGLTVGVSERFSTGDAVGPADWSVNTVEGIAVGGATDIGISDDGTQDGELVGALVGTPFVSTMVGVLVCCTVVVGV